MEERPRLSEFVQLPVAVNVLQGIVDGVYQDKAISRLEAQLVSEEIGTPFYIISRALIIAVSKDLIKTDDIRLEPIKPLTDKDTVFIDAVHQGMNNSNMMENFGWQLEDVYKQRRRVYKALEVSNDYQIVVWEARRRKLEEQHLKNV
ncbi:hypothetical protein A2W45_00500 [Candidatus Curtissbacteria bacterium RIFCSPHIGHO2_12_41_11]|uniref:Uncharacterized protein n=2 Tax=Candidatus Curtissiibacteriota TaxID=1752717 RepID=A0A1F5H1R7_9BACT|nr:MAG: hypothetical protein A3D07_04550 [Candidatus Curtissbacteria bacterium RIFCSPHIGHO2_02_FULL_42_15]OGD98004.1 MAG: hypothetical protein A2W45_00500 [Candidatus Curtissbacteria bacterium RIFCSPHIGHO2_12_41_11]